MLTVGMLRDFLSYHDDDTPVVIGHDDHSYYDGHVSEDQAEVLGQGYYSEYTGSELDMTDPSNKIIEIIDVIVIS